MFLLWNLARKLLGVPARQHHGGRNFQCHVGITWCLLRYIRAVHFDFGRLGFGEKKRRERVSMWGRPTNFWTIRMYYSDTTWTRQKLYSPDTEKFLPGRMWVLNSWGHHVRRGVGVASSWSKWGRCDELADEFVRVKPTVSSEVTRSLDLFFCFVLFSSIKIQKW